MLGAGPLLSDAIITPDDYSIGRLEMQTQRRGRFEADLTCDLFDAAIAGFPGALGRAAHGRVGSHTKGAVAARVRNLHRCRQLPLPVAARVRNLHRCRQLPLPRVTGDSYSLAVRSQAAPPEASYRLRD